MDRAIVQFNERITDARNGKCGALAQPGLFGLPDAYTASVARQRARERRLVATWFREQLRSELRAVGVVSRERLCLFVVELIRRLEAYRIAAGYKYDFSYVTDEEFKIGRFSL